ncbi:hypothetical protein QQ73_08785, partial [Candidatus Endoriftia persephone str. Guaymas]|nr:hypothetical protein [Candidatus Endoriftia persephone str. Guaymas]
MVDISCLLRLFPETDTVGLFRLFARVEGGYWTVVAHDSGPDFAAGSLFVFQFQEQSGNMYNLEATRRRVLP